MLFEFLLFISFVFLGACLVTAGKARDCKMTAGGLSRAIIGNRSQLLSVVRDVGDGTITTITREATTLCYEYEFEKNSASAAQNLQVNANTYVQQVVSFTIAGYDQATKNILDVLAIADIFAVVQFRGSDKWFIYGLNSSGLKCPQDGANGGSGAAEEDLEGIAMVFQGISTEYAPEVDSSIIDALLLAAP